MINFQRFFVGLRLASYIVFFTGGFMLWTALAGKVTYTTGGTRDYRGLSYSGGVSHRAGPIRHWGAGINGMLFLWIGYEIYRMKSELHIDKANNKITTHIKLGFWEFRKAFPINVFSKILLPSRAKTPLPGQYIFLSDGAGAFEGQFIIVGTLSKFEDAYRRASELASILGIPIEDRSKEQPR